MRKLALIALAALLLIALTPVQAQPAGGRGVIRIGLPGTPEDVTPLNPLLCGSSTCDLLTGLMFPMLQAVDAVAGTYTPAADGNFGLTASIAIVDDRVAVFTLRDDLVWTDGTAVTAYDVFYSYLAATNARVGSSYRNRVAGLLDGAVPLDDHRIAFIYASTDCVALDETQFPVIPAHVFEPEIVDVAAYFDLDGNLPAQFAQWEEDEIYPDARFGRLLNNPFNTNPTVTAGPYRFDELRPLESIRLVSMDGQQSILALVLPDGLDEVDVLLQGGLDVVLNPPRSQWDDLMTHAELQAVTYPGPYWYYINFNTADYREPMDAFDEDGERLDQGYHPLFGDPRVRRAIQMALDIPALIEATFDGYGFQLAADQLPQSWAFDAALEPVARTIRDAEFLLDEAGWRDVDSDGVRECDDCPYSTTGRELRFELGTPATAQFDILALLIQRQLAPIGVSVTLSSSSAASAQFQSYDAYLGRWYQPLPVNPDHSSLFTSLGDVVGIGQNAGSYYNPEVDALLEAARTVAACDIGQRAALYRQAGPILQADQPYVWLLAEEDMAVARDGVLGFNPLPGAPLWNIREWVVVE